MSLWHHASNTEVAGPNSARCTVFVGVCLFVFVLFIIVVHQLTQGASHPKNT